MKKISKITIIFIIFLLINISFANTVRATSFDEVINQATGFINTGSTQFETSGIIAGYLNNQIRPIAQALRTIGIGILLCITAYMGIKWVTAKPDEVAKLKQQSIGLLVSAIVIIGAYTIWTITLNIVSKL